MRPALHLAALAALSCASCSIDRFATERVANALSATGDVFASDDDPELVREASPFGIKLMESVLASQPEHAGLLTALARSCVQYGWAFVQQDGDFVEDEDLERAEELRERARRLYLRGREYGLRALEVQHPGLRGELGRDPAAAAGGLAREDLDALYWTAAAWGAALALSKDRPGDVADQPVLEALLDRAFALDEGYGQGALRTLLVSYESARIGGERGADERARAHYARAVELSGGNAAGPHVALAEAVCLPAQGRAEFEDLLGRALAVDPDRQPGRRVENLVVQRRARWLLERTGELFLE